jgi:hypothetical protein
LINEGSDRRKTYFFTGTNSSGAGNSSFTAENFGEKANPNNGRKKKLENRG